MIPERQVGHQQVRFDSIIEAIQYREICPFCNFELELLDLSPRKIQKNKNDKYFLTIRNIPNTEDFLKFSATSNDVELKSDVSLYGFNKIYNYPLLTMCNKCWGYQHSFRLIINLRDINSINCNLKEVLMTEICVRIFQDVDDSSGTVSAAWIKSSFNPNRSELSIDNKSYAIDFVDIDINNLSKLSERFSNLIPFI